MASTFKGLVDQHGRPIEKRVLTTEVAAPSITGVRSPLSGYPGDGLTPVRLANILREADEGDPLRYFELAETIEERDPHYLGVLSTRRRSVAQIDISVEAATDDAADVERADMIRDWLDRDELQGELFDMLDAIGKGVSYTEIIWDTSEGDWRPARLEWRDPRWFRVARHDLMTPRLIGDNGEELELPPFKFICAVMKAKSGLPLRSGLARVATWAWLFKAYTQRDWAIFTQTYGQPIRVGKYGPSASEEDKTKLFSAVANIAGDCAAIVPESMTIEFIEAKNVQSGSGLYKERADWFDQQVSKAVLGQTTTTDAISGGHAVSKEHRQVQEDIERADAIALSAIVNRDLVRPWIDLQYGPQKAYPRVAIARPEDENLDLLSQSLERLVPLGLRVSASEVRDKFGLSDPDDDEEILRPPQAAAKAPPGAGDEPPASEPPPPPEPEPEGGPQPQAETPAQQEPAEVLAERLDLEALPAVHDMMGRIEAMLDAATDLDEFRQMLRNAWPDLDASRLVDAIAAGRVAANAAGRAMVEEGE